MTAPRQEDGPVTSISASRILFWLAIAGVLFFIGSDVAKHFMGLGDAVGVVLGLVGLLAGVQDAARRGLLGQEISGIRDLLQNFPDVALAGGCVVGVPALMTWVGQSSSVFTKPLEFVGGVFTGTGLLFVILSRRRQTPEHLEVTVKHGEGEILEIPEQHHTCQECCKANGHEMWAVVFEPPN